MEQLDSDQISMMIVIIVVIVKVTNLILKMSGATLIKVKVA